MVRKKQPQTAEEFMAELRRDPAYMAQIEAQARRTDDRRLEEQALLGVLAARGFKATDFSTLVERYAPLPSGLVDGLLDLLSQATDPSVQETIVRAIAAARAPYDATVLTQLFDQSASSSLRWAIANTLAETRPTQIASWIPARVQDPLLGKAREMLLLALSRTCSRSIATPILTKMLSQLPGHAALALAEIGTAQELSALRSAYGSSAGWEREQIGRAIAVIQRRIDEGIGA